MLDGLAAVGVGDVDFPVCGLDDGRIGVFAVSFFQVEDRVPLEAVLGEGDGEDVAAAGDGVIDEELAAILDGEGIGSRVGVGELGEGDGIPGLASVLGPALGDLTLSAPAEDLEAAVGIGEETGLDGIDIGWIFNRAYDFPGFAVVAGEFEMDAPPIMLGAAGAEEGAVGELDRFVFDRADKVLA